MLSIGYCVKLGRVTLALEIVSEIVNGWNGSTGLCYGFPMALNCWRGSMGDCTMAGEAKPTRVKGERRYSGREHREQLQAIVPEVKAKRVAKEKEYKRKPYSRETFIAVCERMTRGETTSEALDAEGIAPSTFYGWMERESEESEELRMIFGRARFALAEAAFSEALQRSRDLMNEPEIDSARVGAARLLVDTLKWYAERLNPRQYAMQRIEPVAQTVHNVTNNLTIDASNLGADQRSALRSALIAARDHKIIEN